MATTSKRTAKKAAKKPARKPGKKGVPALKQLGAQAQKVQAELTKLRALISRMGGNDGAGIQTELESGPVKIIQPL